MRDIQALVQAAFDASGGPVVFKPFGGVKFLRSAAGHQGDGFGAMLAQGAAEQADLFHAEKIDLFRAGRAGT